MTHCITHYPQQFDVLPRQDCKPTEHKPSVTRPPLRPAVRALGRFIRSVLLVAPADARFEVEKTYGIRPPMY